MRYGSKHFHNLFYTGLVMKRRPFHIMVALAMLAGMAWLGGCQRALFKKDLPRTQFEAYDRMRNRYVPLEEPDVFGNPQPALRARLGKTY